MPTSPQVEAAAEQEVRTRLIGYLQTLVVAAAGRTVATDDWLEASAMLQALPLSTDQHGVALSLLKNAQRYFSANEPGAARFELRLLLGNLQERSERTPLQRHFAPPTASFRSALRVN